jgi:iron complex transport system permease protein
MAGAGGGGVLCIPMTSIAGTDLRRLPAGPVLAGLGGALMIAALLAAASGAAGIPLTRLPAAFGLVASTDPAQPRDALVLWAIRGPRIAATALTGALLAVAGALMQGLFRNPLADPALAGVGHGGALAAALVIVLGDRLQGAVPFAALPAAAFAGALAATLLLRNIASRDGRTSMAMFLLAGLALGALANAAIGLLVFIADDRQLRDLSFWMLGSFAGATWSKVMVLAPLALVALGCALPLARRLDLLALGEAEAFHAGVAVERLKTQAIVLVSLMTGAAVATAGIIGFIGLIVPHALRLVAGPSHRLLLPAAALLGAALLTVADTLARTLAAPAEVPIGVLTALLGAPVFLALLLRRRGVLT